MQQNGQPGKAKGLRDLLAEMSADEKRSGEELFYIKKQRINGREAAGSLLHRQSQLRARYEALTRELAEIDARMESLAQARAVIEWGMRCTCPSIGACTCGIHSELPDFVESL